MVDSDVVCVEVKAGNKMCICGKINRCETAKISRIVDVMRCEDVTDV